MRFSLVPLAAVLLAAGPLQAVAADALRGPGAFRSDGCRAPVYRDVVVESVPRTRGIAVRQFSGERLRVIDRDGTVLTRSYPDPEPPKRLERRIYVREGQPGRPFLLYGGFYGLDRWGYGREGW